MLRSGRVVTGVLTVLAALVLTGCSGGIGTTAGTAAVAPNENARASDEDLRQAGAVVTQVVAKKLPRIGDVVTDSQGWVFYRWDEDSAKPPTSNCDESCADTWPPIIVEDGDDLPTLRGVDPDDVGTVERDNGELQLTIGGWPMYRYAYDAEPGDWSGQAANGTWFVATKDGRKNLKQLQGPGDSAEGSEESQESQEQDTENSSDGGSGENETQSDDYGDGGSGGY